MSDQAFKPKILAAVLSLEQRLKQQENVASFVSPLSIMRFIKCRFSEQEKCDSIAISSSEEASQLWTLFAGGGDAYPMVDSDRRYLRLRAFVKTDNSAVMTPLEEMVRTTAVDSGAQLLVGGPAIMAKALGDGIFKATGEKVLIIILIAYLAGALIFRSFLAGFLFTIPSGFAAGACYAFLGWSGTTLNVATASIAALAVGVGVDYLIYFTFRLREMLQAGMKWDDAIKATHQTAGGASLCVATAVAGGYLVLNLSREFMPHRWLGEMIPLSILTGLVATLLIYPILLNMLRPSFLFKNYPSS
ncbi:membrane hypothetical protein [Gammaproteobacteria bacterium]